MDPMADLESLRFRVPKSQLGGLRRLVSLSEAEVAQLRRALESASPAMEADGIVDQIKNSLAIPIADLSAVVGVLFSLAFSRDRYNIKTEQIVADVIEAAQTEKLFEATNQDSRSFAVRLGDLLNVQKAIGASSKALDVFLRHKKSFVSARILTDIRPVFSEGESPIPLAAMIVHNIEIISHVDDEHVAEYVALDTEDLLTLRTVVDRALQKEASLKETITGAGISYIDALPG
jgi:hypothetical protein